MFTFVGFRQYFTGRHDFLRICVCSVLCIPGWIPVSNVSISKFIISGIRSFHVCRLYPLICEMSYNLERSNESHYWIQNISLFEVDECLFLVDTSVIYLKYRVRASGVAKRRCFPACTVTRLQLLYQIFQ